MSASPLHPRRVLASLALCLAAACGAAPVTDHAARGASPRPAPFEPAADPGTWAAAAADHCGPLGFDQRSVCYDDLLTRVLDAAGVEPAMLTLERIGELDAEMYHHGHVLAHHIGIAAYRGADELGAVFAECRPSFQSGCYHGVIQAFFADAEVADSPAGLTADRVDAVCADHRGADGNRWLLFQCVHGIGHGLVAMHGNDLRRALRGCDALSDPWEREGCYGGAFMENVVSATMPHHAPRADDEAHGARPDGQAHHAHHDHAHHRHEHHDAEHHEHHAHDHDGPGDPWIPLDPADPHYPCSVLDARYRTACYSMQTSAVLFWSGGEIEPGIRLCEGAPEPARRTCYVSLGRDINAYAHHDHDRAASACMRVRPDFQAACLTGVVKNLIDVTARPADGIAFCDALPGGSNRERCFQAVGEQVAVLETSPERRALTCRPLRGTDGRACRFGAGVADDGPAAASG